VELKEVNLENAFHKRLHKQSRCVVAQEEFKDQQQRTIEAANLTD
jgi:hypothetical protein